MLSQPTKEAIVKLQKSYPQKRSALIPALHLAQAEVGFLPPEVQEEVARLFDLDPNEVQAVVTFYDMFYEEPVGRHILHVCKNISCMLHGGDKILASLCQKLRVRPGETTEDGAFTVIASECLAACDRAPMMLVDDEVVGPVREEDLDQVLANAQRSTGHPCPMDKVQVDHG